MNKISGFLFDILFKKLGFSGTWFVLTLTVRVSYLLTMAFFFYLFVSYLSMFYSYMNQVPTLLQNGISDNCGAGKVILQTLDCSGIYSVLNTNAPLFFSITTFLLAKITLRTTYKMYHTIEGVMHRTYLEADAIFNVDVK
jgi:hypothetical protein